VLLVTHSVKYVLKLRRIMDKVFPIGIAIAFFVASVVCFFSGQSLKALFYFFSGALNVVVIFM